MLSLSRSTPRRPRAESHQARLDRTNERPILPPGHREADRAANEVEGGSDVGRTQARGAASRRKEFGRRAARNAPLRETVDERLSVCKMLWYRWQESAVQSEMKDGWW